MPVIARPDANPLNPTAQINVPCMELPSFRYLLSRERKTLKNVLIQSPYALGDCVCAEPAIRFAVKNFKDCAVSLVTPYPELFTHLELRQVLNQKTEKNINWDAYHVLRCYYGADEMQSEFVQNFNMSIPDYIATCLFKGQIPVEDRDIRLPFKEHSIEEMPAFDVRSACINTLPLEARSPRNAQMQ